MRLDAVGPQDVGHAAAGAPHDGAQEARRPPAAPRRRGRECELHDLLNRVGWRGMVAAAGFRTVRQPVHARCTKRRRIRAGCRRQVETRGDLRAAQAIGTQENHTGTTYQTRGGRCACDKRFQRLLLFTRRSHAVRVGHRHALDHAFDLISTAVQ